MITKEQAEATLATLAELAGAVKARRKALGIGQRTAAGKIGVSQTTVERVEAGLMPNGGNLKVILRWLVDTAWIEEV